jgi:VanZ family protein
MKKADRILRPPDRPDANGESPAPGILDLLGYWLPPICWCVAILTLSGDLGSSRNTFALLKWLWSWFFPLSPDTVNFLNACLRKLGHALAYGLCYFWWYRAFHGEAGVRPSRAFALSMALCLVTASLDEWHQGRLVSRTGNFWDVALDMTGALIAACLTKALWRPGPNQTANNLSSSPPQKSRML